MSELVIVWTWKEFESLAANLKSNSIVYSLNQNTISKTKEPACQGLILPRPNPFHIYLDFPKGNAFGDVTIPLREKNYERFLEDLDLIKFLKKELGKEGLSWFSFFPLFVNWLVIIKFFVKRFYGS